MTFIAAVATGLEAVADLHRQVDGRIQRGEVAWVEHRGQAVAWSATSRFVSSHDDGNVVVVLDGQLHNLFAEDRSQAQLLHARYGASGTDLAVGLLGDFVAIVLDRTRRALLVCRDPLGVRPWYQSTCGRRHSGASDEATLCGLPWVDDRVDEAEALAYLAFSSLSRGPTLHRGITTLAPGATWRSDEVGQHVHRHFSWDIPPRPEMPWEEAAELCRAVLDTAVDCRLRAAGASSSELSGGLDSSSVVGTAIRLGQPPLVGRLLFAGRTADERGYSDAAIAYWDLDAISVEPWIPTSDELDELVVRLRRPVPDANFTMFASLFRAFVEAGHPLGLTGLGGDDAFVDMGVDSRVVSAIQQHQWAVLGRLLRGTVAAPRQAWLRTWRPTLRHVSPRGRPRYPGYVSDAAARELDLAERFRRPPRLTGVDAVDQRAVNLTTGYLSFVLEFRAIVADMTDRRSTHPFLDARVVQALYGLNPWFPVREGHYRALQPAAYEDRLPPQVRTRRTKAEFSEVFWPQVRLQGAIDRVTNGPLTERGWLNLPGFDRILNGARENRSWAALPLSRAVELDRWLRRSDG